MMCLSIRNSLSTKQNVLDWIGRQRSKEIQALWITLIIRMHRAHTTSCDDKIYYLFKWLICHVHITIYEHPHKHEVKTSIETGFLCKSLNWTGFLWMKWISVSIDRTKDHTLLCGANGVWLIDHHCWNWDLWHPNLVAIALWC